MFVVVAVATCFVAKVAMELYQDEAPKRGIVVAKKKYGLVCVTMPTARIRRN